MKVEPILIREKNGINMKVKLRDSKYLGKEEARKHTLRYVDTILQFLESLHDAKPNLGFQQPVILMKEMRERIEKSSPPLRSQDELKAYLIPVLNVTVNFLPSIRSNLHSFWQAQKAIIEECNKSNTSYDPANILVRSFEQIEDINKRSEQVLERFVDNPNDEVNIDAVFYIHILRTETTAKN